MNTLLDKLKQQAGIESNPDQEGLDIFAKLIVEECYNVVVSRPNIGTSLAGHYMKKHFGVNE